MSERSRKNEKQVPKGPPGGSSTKGPGASGASGERQDSPTPRAKIDQLKKTLAENGVHAQELTNRNAELAEDIQELEKAWVEVEQLVSAYTNSIERIRKDKKTYDEYWQTKRKMIDAAVKDKKDTIDKVIADYEESIEKAQCKLKQATADDQKCKEEYEKAKKAQQEKQWTYDKVKRHRQDIGKNLQELGQLRDSIESADNQQDTASMYFLIKEIETVLEQTKTEDVDRYKKRLFKEWEMLKPTKDQLRESEKKLNEAKDKLEECQQRVETLVANRRAEISKQLTDM
jgi:chromosome segregation ATPase